VIPLVRSVSIQPGVFRLARDTRFEVADEHLPIARRLASKLETPCSLDRSAAAPAIRFELDAELAQAQYRVQVSRSGVQLAAGGHEGLVHAATTLAQLAVDRRIPCVTIHDWPRFAWRGMHLDVSRHFFAKPFVLRFLEWMADYKLNVFHWHLTDDQGWRLEVPKRPLLTEVGAWRDDGAGRYGGYYTKADVREVVTRARELGIRVVPEIEMPGHVSAVLAAYPELSCSGAPVAVATTWGVHEHALCIGNDETLAFLRDVLDVVVELFPDPVVHVGGDECPTDAWAACPRCRSAMNRHGSTDVADLHGLLLRDVAGHLRRHGRRIAGWGEIQEHVPDRDAIVLSWQGLAAAQRAALAGNDVVACPQEHCFFDFRNSADDVGRDEVLTLEQVYAFDPSAFEGPSERVLGGQANVWTEYLTQPSDVARHVFPRIAALAEVLWSDPEARAFRDFERRLAEHRSPIS